MQSRRRTECGNSQIEDTKPTNELDSLTKEERAQLSDESIQKAHLEAYMEQMRRRNCPGCGETETF
ncbi:hypothetical protein Enr13x_36730 [Stieleria neptunia]|uniref:Uncharacterized protein n=1 Tax=Stieleria neptunia TaxID=2527979 RepID=A0A518HSH7_9BACT|nr:hypothetical protein Enr13x_36730 [Stieleria neptunia]